MSSTATTAAAPGAVAAAAAAAGTKGKKTGTSAPDKLNAKTASPLFNLVAGGVAGAVEATVTYPMEFVKTQAQLQDPRSPVQYKGPWDCARATVQRQGLGGLYKGLSALVIGTSSKAAVRFVAFEQIKNQLADSDGNITSFKTMLAGLGAGIAEGAVVVTPTETIKTKLIHDQSRATPRYNGLVHGVSSIVREEGIMGIYRGLFPVIMRQGANQSVRFSVYSTLKSHILSREGGAGRDAALPWYTTFGIGVVAGTAVVYTTMPLDVVKTRMQGLGAKQKYSNSFQCIWKIFREEGVFALWKGSTARLSRLVLSGGIVFLVYERTLQFLNELERPSARESSV